MDEKRRQFGDVGASVDLSRTHVYLLLVVGVGLVSRGLLFWTVPVNYDTGFYLYDAYRALSGTVPVADFFSRSPLFHYVLGGGLAVVDSPLVAGRLVMALVSCGLGVGLYHLTARLHSREAGLWAATIFLLTPLTMVWGLWVKTEQLAQLVAVIALAFYVPKATGKRLSLRVAAVFGAAMGAGFLVRRVLVVHAGTVGLFVLFYRIRRQDDSLAEQIRVLVATYGSMVVTVLGAYALMARFRPGKFFRMVNIHAMDLVDLLNLLLVTPGDGAGRALGVLGLFPLCNMCGDRTVYVTVETLMMILPAMLLIWKYWSCLVADRWSDYRHIAPRRTTAAMVTLLVVAAFLELDAMQGPLLLAMEVSLLCLALVYVGNELLSRLTDWRSHYDPSEPRPVFDTILVGSCIFVWAAFAFRTLERIDMPYKIPLVSGIVLFGTGAVAVLHTLPTLDRDQIWRPTLLPIAVIPGGLMLAYLFRGQVLFVTYFQDVLPYLCVFAGILVAGYQRRIAADDIRLKTLVVLLGVMTVLSTMGAPYIAAPRGGIQSDYDIGDRTVSTVDDLGTDLGARTEPGDEVFTAQPIYALSADLENIRHFSRQYWYFTVFPDQQRTREFGRRIAGDLRSGEVPYVLVEQRMGRLLENSVIIRTAFEENYCPVTDTPPAYDELGVKLYVYAESAPDCG